MSRRPGLILNTLAQAGVRMLGSFCALVLTWLIARHSVDDLGVFRTLFTYFLICEFLPLLGMQTYLFREISLNRGQTGKYGLHALVFALAVSLVGVVGLVLLAVSGGYSAEIGRGLFVVAAGLPATAASLVGLSILVGTGQTATFSVIQGVETLVRTLAGIVIISLGWGVLPAVMVMVAARWLVLLGYWRAVQPLFVGERVGFERSFFRSFVSHVPTFAGITLLAMVLRFAVPAVLPWVLGDASAGQFAAAYIFIDLALLVPTAMTSNLVPLLARKGREAPAVLLASCQQGVKVMALGVLPVSAVVAGVARPMFASVFPGNLSYAVSASVLEVLIWICALQAVDQVLSAALIARGKQETDLHTLMIGAAGLIVLLAALVPLAGVLGAAYAVLGGVVILVVTRFILVARHLGSLSPVELLWRPVVAALGAVIASLLVSRWHWLGGAAAGGLAYLGSLGLLGSFSRAERESVLGLFQTGKA